MRKISLLILLLIITGNVVYAADSVKVHVRNKWCSNKDTIFVYDGGFNEIQVFGKDIKATDVRLRSLSGKLKLGDVEVKRDTAAAMAMPTESEGDMTLQVVSKKTGAVLKEVALYAAPLPEPRAKVGEKIRGGIVDKKALLDETCLFVYYPNSSYCYPYKITGYTFKAKKGNVPMQKEVVGFFIPTDIKQLIKDLPENGAAEFTDIIAVCPECYEKRLKDIKILVK